MNELEELCVVVGTLDLKESGTGYLKSIGPESVLDAKYIELVTDFMASQEYSALDSTQKDVYNRINRFLNENSTTRKFQVYNRETNITKSVNLLDHVRSTGETYLAEHEVDGVNIKMDTLELYIDNNDCGGN